MHIGQPSINPVALHGEPGVIESELVQDGGVDVVDLGGVGAVERFVAPGVAWAVGGAALDAAAAEPVGEAVGVVVAAFAALRGGHAAELGGPEDDRVVAQDRRFR